MRQKRILIGAVVIMLLISISVITVVVFQNRQGNVVGTSETITTSEMAVSETIVPETKNTGMTESVKESVTESETKAIISAPEELEHLLAENGNTAEQIAAIGCRQLITVESSGSNALPDHRCGRSRYAVSRHIAEPFRSDRKRVSCKGNCAEG